MQDTDFVIFLIIYMMVVGIVSSVFNPGMYTFGEEDYIGNSQFEESQQKDNSFFDKIVNAVSSVIDAFVGIVTFLYAGFTLNIPAVPAIIRIVMCSPIWGGTAYLIAKYIRGMS